MTVCGSPLSLSLLGVKRTCSLALHMSAFDPKRTLAVIAVMRFLARRLIAKQCACCTRNRCCSFLVLVGDAIYIIDEGDWYQSETIMRSSNFLKRTPKRKKMRVINFKEYRAEAQAAHKLAYERMFGSHGAASPVRRIDPITGEIIGTIKSH